MWHVPLPALQTTHPSDFSIHLKYTLKQNVCNVLPPTILSIVGNGILLLPAAVYLRQLVTKQDAYFQTSSSDLYAITHDSLLQVLHFVTCQYFALPIIHRLYVSSQHKIQLIFVENFNYNLRLFHVVFDDRKTVVEGVVM